MSEVKTINAEEVSTHNTRDDLWIILEGKVYDITKYLDEHPGGEEVILDVAGDDGTEAFNDIGHSEEAMDLLKGLYVGELLGGVKPKSKSSGGLSDSGDMNLPLIAAVILVIAIIAYFLLQ